MIETAKFHLSSKMFIFHMLICLGIGCVLQSVGTFNMGAMLIFFIRFVFQDGQWCLKKKETERYCAHF